MANKHFHVLIIKHYKHYKAQYLPRRIHKKETTNDKYVEHDELTLMGGGSAKWYCHFGRGGLAVSHKTIHIVLISDPMIMLLGIYPTDLKTCSHKTRIQMFTALFIIVKMCRTSICE